MSFDIFRGEDWPELAPPRPDALDGERLGVPQRLDVLPNGRQALIVGDPEGLKRLNHKQGDNPFGFQNDCGLVAAEDILRQFGLKVTEADVVRHAINRKPPLCFVDPRNPGLSGGTDADDRVQILNDFGVPAHIETRASQEQLAKEVESGHATMISVNAGVLWNDPSAYGTGDHNHVVVVTGVARDPSTGAVQGFFINDSGPPHSGRFVDVKLMQGAWQKAGGIYIATDAVAPAYLQTAAEHHFNPADLITHPATGAVAGAAFTAVTMGRQALQERRTRRATPGRPN